MMYEFKIENPYNPIAQSLYSNWLSAFHILSFCEKKEKDSSYTILCLV